jgi:hypothetical protein
VPHEMSPVAAWLQRVRRQCASKIECHSIEPVSAPSCEILWATWAPPGCRPRAPARLRWGPG